MSCACKFSKPRPAVMLGVNDDRDENGHEMPK